MNRKTWNLIYFIGFLLPVCAYFLSFVRIPQLTDSSQTISLFNVDLWNSIVSNVSSLAGFMPVSSLARLIVGSDVFSSLACWCVGADFVIWLSIIHIVMDLFMLLSKCLSRLFNKFGGAD